MKKYLLLIAIIFAFLVLPIQSFAALSAPTLSYETNDLNVTASVIESLPGPVPNAKTSNIEYSVAQESNLCLAVYKNGSRSWRFKQKFR